MNDREYHQGLIDAFRENHKDSFRCTYCGCPKTMANLDKNNNELPGKLCLKCGKAMMVMFVDQDAPWKHSKGPWFAKEVDGSIVIESETKIIACVKVESIKQARLDADLMATAPELLFWLGRVLDLVYTKADEGELNEAIFNALSAIAKAERWAS